MLFGYRAALALTSLILLAAPAWASDKRTVRAERRDPGRFATYAPADLYSRRALRRARTVLQLKLLELREARLERVRAAILRHLPVETILRE